MMNISRENYEVWFIDFLDGKLDGPAREELNTFLRANPDLERELNAIEELKLKPSTISFDDANRLHKSESDLMGMTRPDYLLVKQMEEGLTENEEKELAAEIRNDELLIKRGIEFQQSKLVAELLVYERKAALLQKRIPSVWVTFGRIAAAGVAAALVLTLWNSDFFIVPEKNELAMQPLQSLPAVVALPDIPEANLVKVDISDETAKKLPDQLLPGNNVSETSDEDILKTNIRLYEKPVAKLRPGVVKMELAGVVPNAYEAGLRHMMPMYLDNNRDQEPLFSLVQPKSAVPEGETFLMKGLQFVDRVSGDLVNFDKLYDEDGNFVAYNLKAGNFEMERKLRR